MAGTDNHRNSSSRRVNMKIRGGVSSFNRNLFRHQLSEEENMDKMGKTFLSIIFTFGAFLLRFLL